MQPHQERVVAELKELKEKREKLAVFLLGNTFKSLDADERERLLQQHEVMGQYANILSERIANF